MDSGLVKVTAKDGSVWWVKPAMVSFYAALESAFATAPSADVSSSYWRMLGYGVAK